MELQADKRPPSEGQRNVRCTTKSSTHSRHIHPFSQQETNMYCGDRHRRFFFFLVTKEPDLFTPLPCLESWPNRQVICVSWREWAGCCHWKLVSSVFTAVLFQSNQDLICPNHLNYPLSAPHCLDLMASPQIHPESTIIQQFPYLTTSQYQSLLMLNNLLSFLW